jgi:hypothetical protein
VKATSRREKKNWERRRKGKNTDGEKGGHNRKVPGETRNQGHTESRENPKKNQGKETRQRKKNRYREREGETSESRRKQEIKRKKGENVVRSALHHRHPHLPVQRQR